MLALEGQRLLQHWKPLLQHTCLCLWVCVYMCRCV